MKVLLLGVGMQGKAALHDLVATEAVARVIAADRDYQDLLSYVSRQGFKKVDCRWFDVDSPASLTALLQERPDVVIDLLPVALHLPVTEQAIEHGIHVVNSSYVDTGMRLLHDKAVAQNVTVLPEFGMDPGLDLVLLGHAVRSFDTITAVKTYGAGFPEESAADNPLKYKITWTFEGVLKSYKRGARVIQNGQVKDIKDTEIFHPENTHTITVEGLGMLEAYPNGNALDYVSMLGLDLSLLEDMGRYVLRWPGHCALWKTLVDLHLLDAEPVVVDGCQVDRRRFLAATLAPQLQYQSHERDVVVVRVEVAGLKANLPMKGIWQLIDRRDLHTGLSAMSRTVGFTCSIGAQLLGAKRLTKAGLLSPVTDVPYRLVSEELAKRGIAIVESIEESIT